MIQFLQHGCAMSCMAAIRHTPTPYKTPAPLPTNPSPLSPLPLRRCSHPRTHPELHHCRSCSRPRAMRSCPRGVPSSPSSSTSSNRGRGASSTSPPTFLPRRQPRLPGVNLHCSGYPRPHLLLHSNHCEIPDVDLHCSGYPRPHLLLRSNHCEIPRDPPFTLFDSVP